MINIFKLAYTISVRKYYLQRSDNNSEETTKNETQLRTEIASCQSTKY